METKLMKIRNRKNLSRWYVSQQTGIPYTSLSKLEEGIMGSIPKKHVQKLQKFYGMKFLFDDLVAR